MRLFRPGLWLLIVISLGAFVSLESGRAQAPARAAAQTATRPAANLAQLMRGILFPNVNIIYAAQNQDPATIKPADDPNTSVNPLTGTWGGWAAVENSGLAISEASRLLTVPGRLCSNGKPVPLQNADWAKFVQGLRDAGLVAYKAGQAKSMDALGDASDKVTTACQNCHDVYRDKGGPEARCAK